MKNKPTPKGNSYFIVEEKFLTDYKQTDFTEESLLDELATPNLTELATPNLTLDPEFLGDSRVILRPEFDALKFQVEELIRQTKPAISEEIECQLRRQVDGLRAELDSKNVIINILQKQLEAINSMNRETQFLPTNVLSTNSTTTQYKLPKKFATKGNHRKSSDKQFTIPINNRFHTLESDYNENVNLVVNGNHGNYSNGRNRQLNETLITNNNSRNEQNSFHTLESDYNENVNLVVNGNHDRNRFNETLITDNNSRNEQNSQVNKNTTSNKKRSVTILGDSMVKGIEGYKMKKALNNKINVYIKSFPGAIIEDMYSYAKPSLKHDPNVIIIHCGTNDLREEKPAEIIADEIVTLAHSLKTDSNEVVVSGIVPRRDKLDEKRKEVNNYLSIKLNERNFGFIDNTNINITSNLNKIGLHLNYSGTKLLADNFLDIINL